MKRPTKKIDYVIYPPNYKPGDGYYKKDTITKAKNKAISLGFGSEIVKHIKKNKRSNSSHWMDVAEIHYDKHGFYVYWKRNALL